MPIQRRPRFCAAIGVVAHPQVALLIDSGADPNVGTLSNYTPLHFAVETGNYDIAAMLVPHGANRNTADDGGITPCDYIDYFVSQGNQRQFRNLVC